MNVVEKVAALLPLKVKAEKDKEVTPIDFATDFKKNDQFSDEVEKALKEVLPSEDMLDKPHFDTIAYLNSKFNEDTPLETIDAYASSLSSQIEVLDTKIVDVIRDQSFSGKQAEKDLHDAKLAIHELFNKIKDIKSKAEQSEIMVQEICRDIKQLDWAKKHLTTTIGALKRLQMLVTAIDRLQPMAGNREYKEAAGLMGAVNQLSKHFDAYSKVPKVRDLIDRVNRIKEDLSHQIFEDFNEMGEISDMVASDSKHPVESLHQACLVVDALEGKTKQRLINSFAKTQIRKYEKVFRKGSEESTLDKVPERFKWFVKMLLQYDSFYSQVFPYYWKVPEKITLQFCEKTREHFEAQLVGLNPDTVDAAPMLLALQRSLAFERELKNRFDEAYSKNDPEKNGSFENKTEIPNSPDYDEDGNPIDPNSAKAIKLKYAKIKETDAKKQQDEDNKVIGEAYQARIRQGQILMVQENKEEDIVFEGILSKCFEPYMAGYVRTEKATMMELASAGGAAIDAVNAKGEGERSVLDSSIKIFQYMKSSITRCIGLSAGQTFFSLQKEFQNVLFAYIDALVNKMPKAQKMQNIGAECYKFKDEDARDFVSNVVNTCEYCSKLCEQLSSSIKEKIQEPFKEQVDYEPIIEKFYDTVSLAMTILVSGVDVELDNALTTMQNMTWSISDVGDISPYVRQFQDVLNKHVPKIRNNLAPAHFRSFADKLIASFMPRYTANIYKCRSISETGAQQLQLDTNAVKTLFIKMPILGLDKDKDAIKISEIQMSPSYSKNIGVEIQKAENLLKMIGTPADKIVGNFELIYGAKGTPDVLTRIMNLKGMSKNEQRDVLSKVGMVDTKHVDLSGPIGPGMTTSPSIKDMTAKQQNIIKDVGANIGKGLGNIWKGINKESGK